MSPNYPLLSFDGTPVALLQAGEPALALREYRDLDGRAWMVWSVAAKLTSVRAGADRRLSPSHTEEERRSLNERRGGLPPAEWLQGWLCFQTLGEKRRLMPVPQGWEQASVPELDELRTRAAVVAEQT